MLNFNTMGCTHGCYKTRLQRFGQVILCAPCETLVNFVVKKGKPYPKPSRSISFFKKNQSMKKRPQRLGLAHFQLSHFRLQISYFSFLTLDF
jgi:hypothetical protein